MRGTPLTERLRSSSPEAASAPDGASGESALRRLNRWRRPPFDNPELWCLRLRADDLDEKSLLALLGEPADALARRLGQPAWAARLQHAMAGPPYADGDGTNDVLLPEVDGHSPYLARAAWPLLDDARGRLRAVLERLAGEATPAPFRPGELLEQVYAPLPWVVQGMLSRTLALELHLAGMRGELPDGTSEERFAAFLDALSKPSRQWTLLRDYPVLARQLATAVDQWLVNSRVLAERIVSDAEAIRNRFASGSEIGCVAEVVTGVGDRHRGGQAVAKVRWESGLVLVYKPRSLRVDEHFADLLEWLNAAGLRLPMRTLTHLDCGGHGWVEFVRAEPCADEAAVRRFYHRQGVLLALLELLRANDSHAENLIAAGDQPVLVDVETVLQPVLPPGDARSTEAERAAEEAAAASVLQVGLLPATAWPTRDGKAVDLSGLGYRPGQRTSVGLPVLTGVGTDRMRVRLERMPLNMPDNRPVAKDAELNLLDYTDDLIAGYTELHVLCRAHKDRLAADDGPLAAFGDDHVRVLLRSTMTYGTLLRTGFHPDVLRDGLDRDRHFDFLWRQVTDTPALGACVPAERADLWRNDIPYFSSRPGRTTLFDSDDRPVPGIELGSALERVRQDLAGRDDEHLDGQLRLIRGSLATVAINATDDLEFPEYPLPDQGDRVPAADLLVAAQKVGDQLAREAFRRKGSAQWLGLGSQAGRNWSLGPLRPDVFNGLSGVALFLATLGAMTGERRHTDLARDTVATVRAQLDRGLITVPAGMAGLPGVVYAFCRLSALLDDGSLVDEAEAIAASLLGTAEHDTRYDMVGGSAGTIAALRALHAVRPEGPAATVIAEAAHRLVESAERHPLGAGWVPAWMREDGLANVPLAGFGHGTAGIAFALAEAAALLGERRYAAMCHEALGYERGLFDPEIGDWRDVRTLAADRTGICAWCHGAVGVGLGRLAIRTGPLADDPEVDAEIAASIATTRRAGFGRSHSLCHGDFGSLDLLLTASSVLCRPDLRDEAARRTAGILGSMKTNGWMCGVPFGLSTPSLMVGLSGIGYGLLRAADPGGVPSVLTLQAGKPLISSVGVVGR
ncbi:type 2 lantipeptide synthetase LanM [Nonomuraea deserti]|uniref:Type 2 lantipeptide synthetase LanM n=1 Tax=Nonomuraea deserti TaxID=1848322 RepID=A0A4R4W6A8_9ACTN|nr:type 2 lanthipeptide synthetase LanM family protein [Nonomuraea deserti]TDD11573.1 type 2 lantipeptide synthetase LanM [Nonomuraea deserti]